MHMHVDEAGQQKRAIEIDRFRTLGNASHGGRLDAGDFATLDSYRHTTLRLHMLGAIEDRRIQEYRYVGFSH